VDWRDFEFPFYHEPGRGGAIIQESTVSCVQEIRSESPESHEKKTLSPVIASVAKQSPGQDGDCFAACGGSQCNGRNFSTATVENFLPQQGWGG
jgi:hypothetical protein